MLSPISLIFAAAAAVAALAATGTALGVAASDASAPSRSVSLVAGDTASPEPPPASPTPPMSGIGRISSGRAAEIALSWAGGGRVTEIEAEVEHGRPVWKVELVKAGVEAEVYVDRETGAVVKAERDAAGDRTGNEDRTGTDDRSGTDDRTATDDRSGSDDGSGSDHAEDDGAGADDHGGDHGGDGGDRVDGGSGRDHPETTRLPTGNPRPVGWPG
jgi:hypothetical protein